MQSKTRTALTFFIAVMAVALVERIVRVAILVAFWPAIAFFAPIDPERTPPTSLPSAGLATAGTILLLFTVVELLLTSVGFYLLRSGRVEFKQPHPRRIAYSGIAIVLYLLLAFVGNIGLSVAFGTFLPWLGYTFTVHPTRYAAFTLVNVGLALLAGLVVWWIVERFLDRATRTLALAALVLGVGSAIAVAVTGLAVLLATPIPAQPVDIPLSFGMAHVVGDALSGFSIALWLLAYRRTLARFQRGDLVPAPPRPVWSTPPPYVPPSPPMWP